MITKRNFVIFNFCIVISVVLFDVYNFVHGNDVGFSFVAILGVVISYVLLIKLGELV